MDKDREKAFLQAVDLAEEFYGKGFTKEDYDKVRAAIKDPNNKWMRYINQMCIRDRQNCIRNYIFNEKGERFYGNNI